MVVPENVKSNNMRMGLGYALMKFQHVWSVCVYGYEDWEITQSSLSMRLS